MSELELCWSQRRGISLDGVSLPSFNAMRPVAPGVPSSSASGATTLYGIKLHRSEKMRDEQKQPWQEIKHLKTDSDLPVVCESAAELRRCRRFEPEDCWEWAREYHSCTPWKARQGIKP